MIINEDSKLRIVSLGLVAVNKPLRTYIVEVVPIERSPFLSGEGTDHVSSYEAKSPDGEGLDAVDLALQTTESYPAEWLPLGSTNRITAPDVRRGEEVLILQFADSPKYFWILWRANPTLRRLETITYMVSNERNENVPLTKDNSYYVHISTHEKLIHIETSKSDGEPFGWVIQLNTKDGVLVIKDDAGDHIFIDAKQRHIQLKNADDSMLELNKRVINMESLDEINMKTKRLTMNASESIKHHTKDYKITTNSYNMTSKSFVFKGSAGVINANTKNVGNFEITNNLRVGGTSTHVGQSTGPGHR